MRNASLILAFTPTIYNPPINRNGIQQSALLFLRIYLACLGIDATLMQFECGFKAVHAIDDNNNKCWIETGRFHSKVSRATLMFEILKH